MSDGLAPKDVRARHATAISEAETFETLGVSRKAAMEFLRSPEGTIFGQRLIEADPGATASTIVDRAIQQIGSGVEIPDMELSAEPLVKIVPAGQQVPSFSPFFARPSVFEEVLASGKSLSDYFGLPIKSEAPRYDIMVMRPLAPTEIFITHRQSSPWTTSYRTMRCSLHHGGNHAMTQRIDPIKLKAVAEHLEWVLKQYPDSEDVQDLLHSLTPLLGDAKAGRVIEPVDNMKIPGAWNFSDGRYVSYKDPGVDSAYVAFVVEMEGGLSDQEKQLNARMDALRRTRKGSSQP